MTNDKNKNTHENGSEDENTGSQITDTAQGLIDKAKETAGQAYEIATEKAASKLDEQKAVVTSGLASVAGSIKQVGESLRETDDQTAVTEITARYGDRLAGQIEQVSNYFEQNDLREIVGDVEAFARKNPMVFIGGAFALGILAARFLKSSKPGQVVSGSKAGQPKKTRRGRAGADNIVSFDSGAPAKKPTSAPDSVKDTRSNG